MKKIEVNEDDFKKLVLMVKLSKAYVNLPPQDLQLGNLWRVAPKLADKLIAKAGMVLVQHKGRLSLKYASEVPQGAMIIGQGYVKPKTEDNAPQKQTDEPAEQPIEQPTEQPTEQPSDEGKFTQALVSYGKPTPADVVFSTSIETSEEPVESEKIHRCRKRKNK